MGIIRKFQASCDECGYLDSVVMAYSSDVKDRLKQLGWTVNNHLFCTICNGTEVVQEVVQVASDPVAPRSFKLWGKK